ncbi:MAG: hypothetical protein K6T86_03530 [Pirellulales bacterium]|nr:hypothetical protein [Pirellulales bacterium]
MKGFDFTMHMRRLCVEIVRRMPELSHIDMGRVAVRFCQTRQAGPYGAHASLTPLRFREGSRTSVRRGVQVAIEPVFDPNGVEMLYLLSFYLPRFLNLPFREKLATVFHELWHISPRFDGDLRRHAGRCYAHGASEQRYHASMHHLASQWLAQQPPPELYDFLRHDFSTLCRLHGGVYGIRLRTPRLIPLPLPRRPLSNS